MKTRLKELLADLGEGKKLYRYRESEARYFHDKKFLGWDDAVEIAINKQLNRMRKKI